MEQSKTTSTIKKNPFNYLRSQMIAKMIIEGLDKHQIYDKCFHKNQIDRHNQLSISLSFLQPCLYFLNGLFYGIQLILNAIYFGIFIQSLISSSF